MNSSLRFFPNVANGGDSITLILEGLSNPESVKNKLITIELIEVDNKQDRGAAGNTDDLLATFECRIEIDQSVSPPNFYFGSIKRTDSNIAALPSPEMRTVTAGVHSWNLPYKPEWKPPHILLQFETSASFTGPLQAFTVLFKGDSNERENYVYELAVRLKDGTTIIADTTLWPSQIDCNNLLAHNCRQAAFMLYHDHRDLISLRNIGTHYGSNFVPADTAAFNTKKSTYKLNVISCIGYVLETGRLGHEKTLASTDWKTILKSMSQGKGTTLAKGLEKAGWIGIYYNPDTKNPFDKNHPNIDWNEHPYSYSVAKSKRQYYGLAVHDLIVNYRPTEVYYDGTPVATKTVNNSTKIGDLNSIPFGFINVRGGMHTAILIDGDVYEVHWDKAYNEPDLFEKTNFETDWPWLSGIIHIPSGFWK